MTVTVLNQLLITVSELAKEVKSLKSEKLNSTPDPVRVNRIIAQNEVSETENSPLIFSHIREFRERERKGSIQ